jgi:hypothetical protein
MKIVKTQLVRGEFIKVLTAMNTLNSTIVILPDVLSTATDKPLFNYPP